MERRHDAALAGAAALAFGVRAPDRNGGNSTTVSSFLTQDTQATVSSFFFDSTSPAVFSDAAVELPDDIVEPVDHAVAGGISSMASFALLFPLDIARTRMQAQGAACNPAGGMAAVLADIWEREGLAGLYRGLSVNLVAVGASQALYFLLYENLRALALAQTAAQRSSVATDLAIAFLAGAFNATFTCPIWVAATRLKLRSKATLRNGGATAGDPARGASGAEKVGEGDGSFFGEVISVVRGGDAWRGLSSSLALCTNPMLQYGVYEQLKGQVLRSWARRKAGRVAGETLQPLAAFVVGALAKSVATVATYPLQLVQTRTRQRGSSGSMWGAFQAMLRECRAGDDAAGGWRLEPLFRGMSAKLTATVLNAALMFMFKEWFLQQVLRLKRQVGPRGFQRAKWALLSVLALRFLTQLARKLRQPRERSHPKQLR